MRRQLALQLNAEHVIRTEQMQIADVLMPALEGHFPDRGLLRGASSEHVATFPAIHPAVGDVKLIDDGDEITIVLGSHTHSHFIRTIRACPRKSWRKK